MGSGACFSLRKMLEGIRNTSAALNRSFFGCLSSATCRCTASCGNRCKWRSSFVSLLRSFRRSCSCAWKLFVTTFQENEFSSFIGNGSITQLLEVAPEPLEQFVKRGGIGLEGFRQREFAESPGRLHRTEWLSRPPLGHKRLRPRPPLGTLCR